MLRLIMSPFRFLILLAQSILLALGQIRDRNLRVSVNKSDMDQSLLGMTYLQRWSSIEIRNGALVLTR